MPRRNKRKGETNIHSPSVYDDGFKKECYGCAFAGVAFKCMTSDGKCLKTKQREEMIKNRTRSN